jgi:hypothetical protein
MRGYATSAEVLRLLANTEPVVLDGRSDALRLVLLTGAEACEQLVELARQHDVALRRISELERLLAHAVRLLETTPLPTEGGSWELFTVTQEIHRALNQTARADRER